MIPLIAHEAARVTDSQRSIEVVAVHDIFQVFGDDRILAENYICRVRIDDVGRRDRVANHDVIAPRAVDDEHGTCGADDG